MTINDDNDNDDDRRRRRWRQLIVILLHIYLSAIELSRHRPTLLTAMKAFILSQIATVRIQQNVEYTEFKQDTNQRPYHRAFTSSVLTAYTEQW